MKRPFVLWLLVVFSGFGGLLGGPAAAVAQDYEFSGVKTHDDSGVYTYHPFEVPAGTTKIYVSYEYTPAKPESLSATNPWLIDGGRKLGNVIDIAVFDSLGFRGASGSNKHSFTIAESAEHTTPSYIPGPLPVGTWQIELGVGWIDPGNSLSYTVSITLSDEAVGETFVPPDYTPVVLADQPGWYKGDLHCHSNHSDGGYSMEVVADYAVSRGLDFLAITDHNAISQNYFLPTVQENYDDLLLIPGVEMTAYNGHANVYNYIGYVPYQGTTPDYDVNAVMAAIHAAGGYFSPNHPAVPNLPVGDFAVGLGWAFPDTDWSQVDFMEAINGPMIVFDLIPNPVNLLAVEWWDALQNEGRTLTIRGGSDDHSAGHGGGSIPAYIGQPTTMVYATELSATAILAAIAQGHCFLMAAGPDGPELYLNASDGQQTVMMGDTIQGAAIELTARVLGGKDTRLDFKENGRNLNGHHGITVDQDDFSYALTLQPQANARYRLELWQGLELLAITNSLYVEPPADDDDDDDDDDVDDNDDDDDDNDNDDADDDDNDDNDDNDDDDESDNDDLHSSATDDDDETGGCGN